MSDPDQESKTHAPTPKRIREFRKKGDIATSKDLTTTLTLAGGIFAAISFSGLMTSSITNLMSRSLSGFHENDPGLADAAIRTFVASCAPAAIGAFAAYTITTLVQLGWPPALRKPTFNLAKPFSLGSIKNILSPSAMGRRALFSTAKVTFVLTCGFYAIRTVYREFLHDPALDPSAVGSRVSDAILLLIAFSGGALTVLAAGDFLWNKRDLMKKMRMTTEEIKREHKEQEGDPDVRRARKRRQRDLAQRRMPAKVKSADVVIVNPTHYAVALRYRAEEGGAPLVVAKGRGPIAAKIRELARQAGIPIMSRPPLTRLIYKLVPEGREIPANVYHAVAEVLAFVYRIKQRGAR